MAITPRLDSIFKPGAPLPPDEAMIASALDILTHSPHGQQLTDLVEKEKITIRITATPQPTAYLPEPRLAYIGFNRERPISPARFVLLLTGVLRTAQQELAGITLAPLTAPIEEQTKVGLAKEEDKLWYMCTVSCELNAQEFFSEYKFLDELRNMGYAEIIALYLSQNHGAG